eukprot:gb/GEZN01004308.1/.p1 GENE.gb/GEZN01004308.1/~~gb/GEZN01004308.1/.p1  ORF type:complete len:602 (-),score=64.93 gb/GEZN01004308.1/:104-1909(-)
MAFQENKPQFYDYGPESYGYEFDSETLQESQSNGYMFDSETPQIETIPHPLPPSQPSNNFPTMTNPVDADATAPAFSSEPLEPLEHLPPMNHFPLPESHQAQTESDKTQTAMTVPGEKAVPSATPPRVSPAPASLTFVSPSTPLSASLDPTPSTQLDQPQPSTQQATSTEAQGGATPSTPSTPPFRTEFRVLRQTNISKEQQELKVMEDQSLKHWEAQESKVKLLLTRLRNGADTCRQLHASLERSTKLLDIVATSITVEDQVAFAFKETGTLLQAAVTHANLNKTTSRFISETHQRVFRESLQVSDSLARDSLIEAARVSKAAYKELNAVKTQRLRTQKAWQSYERSVHERHEAEKQHRLIVEDPFLCCRTFDLETMRLRQVEGEAQKALSEILLDARLHDARRVDSVKSILLDNLVAQRAILEHALKFLNSTIEAVKAIDREVDVNQWVAEGGFMFETTPSSAQPALMRPIFEKATPNLASQCISRLYQQEVDMQGSLLRPKSMFRGWAAFWVVISKSGSLHAFPDQLAHSASFTVSLNDCKTRVAIEVEENVFELSVPNKSVFSLLGGPTLYLFKAHTHDSMEAWMHALSAHISPEGI